MRWAVALAYLGCANVHAAIDTARDAVDVDPYNVTIWNLLGYLRRISGDEAAAQESWLRGIEQVARCGTATRRNLRVESWVANIEACVGHAERALEKVARLIKAQPHNGYIKYRLAHVLAELGDGVQALQILREAVQDGFLSVQLLRREERLGLSSLVDLAAYQQVRRGLEQEIKQLKNKYVFS